MNVDEVSPAYVGEERIKLSVSPGTPARVGQVVQIDVDFSACLPEGASMPLDFIVQGPTEEGFVSKTYRERLPVQLSFMPAQAGPHLVLLREQTHNRWHGKLKLQVEGDRAEA